MEYVKYHLKDPIDFTHPYMTINQMKQMIMQNYNKPRDFFDYGFSAEDMIADLDKQVINVFPGGPDTLDLRMPILVFPIPTGEIWKPTKYGFIAKFEANGETVIYSPIKNLL